MRPRVAVGGVDVAKGPAIAKLDRGKRYTLRQLLALGVVETPDGVDRLMRDGLLDERGDFFVVRRSFRAVNE